eukprot:6470000-Amphidinium_carterae.2
MSSPSRLPRGMCGRAPMATPPDVPTLAGTAGSPLHLKPVFECVIWASMGSLRRWCSWSRITSGVSISSCHAVNCLDIDPQVVQLAVAMLQVAFRGRVACSVS